MPSSLRIKKVFYKYILQEDIKITLTEKFLKIPTFDLITDTVIGEYFSYTFNTNNGIYAIVLRINKGYAWDGPSGPSLDTDNFMLPALVHDVLYQILREDYKGSCFLDVYRKSSDKILLKLCKSEGMGFIRRNYVYLAVRIFAGFAARYESKVRYIEYTNTF